MDRIKHLIFFAIALYIVWAIEQKASNVPEQIHVSLGRNENEYVITWTTFSPNEVSHVWYGTDRDNLVHVVNGKETLFVDGGAAGRKSYVYRAFLSNLKPKTRYYYKCGSKQSISPVMEMITLPSGNRWETRMLVMGDMGVDNARSFPFIQDEVDNHNVDLIFHNGDFAYDMYLYDGKLGDQYMNMMQSVISKLPYQTSPGNHELAYNFSHYVNRFSMYDQIQNGNPKGDHFYAFHVGPALIISFSTEFYYWPSLFNETNKQIQEKWMKSILIEANRGTNRAKHPWILVFGHRPMYCTNDRKDPDCYENALIMRSRLEDMFFEYGVDLAIWAHEHTYERTYPVYRDQIRVNYTSLEPYTNPGAPVHIVTGSAGCNEGLDAFDVSKPWSKFHQSQYGYAKITFHNETTLKFEQIDTGGDWAGQVIDSFTLVQNRHVLSFYYVRRRYNYWNERGIDGPKPTFPFGYTLDKARYDPFDLEIKWLKSYGKLYGVYTGLLPTLIVSDPDLIKQIFVKDFQSFNNRRILNSYHEVWNLNLFSSEYTPWKHYRSMTTPAFSTGKLRSMNPLIERCIQKLFNSLDIVDQFEPKSEFTQFSIDITSASFFATDTGSNPIISQRCLELVDIPAWRSGMVGALPRTILNLFGIESVFRPKALNFIVQFLRTIVGQQRQLAPYQQNDFIRLLIEQNGLKTPPLTDNEVVAQSLIFFLASYEQIASVMTYCSYELAMNQDIQQRLVEELNKIDLSDLEQIVNNVAYLEAIIDESLRKYPPELRMERRVSSQQLVSLDQYNVQLEPDTLIEVPTIALHHNEEYFPQPDKFDPERFSLENRNQIVPYTFIPFGIGPRNCIGTRFAYRVIKICLAQLILRYRLEITPKTPSKLTFKSGNLSLLIPEFNLSICKRNLNKF